MVVDETVALDLHPVRERVADAGVEPAMFAVRVSGGELKRGRELPATMPLSRQTGARIKKATFLRLLASRAAGSVTAAAKAAGIGRASPYLWAKKDQDFEAHFEAAKVAGERMRLDELEEEVDRRARKSDILLMFRVKRLDPRYRDNAPAFPFAQLPGVVRMVQFDPDGTERWLEIGGPAPKKALQAPRDGDKL